MSGLPDSVQVTCTVYAVTPRIVSAGISVIAHVNTDESNRTYFVRRFPRPPTICLRTRYCNKTLNPSELVNQLQAHYNEDTALANTLYSTITVHVTDSETI